MNFTIKDVAKLAGVSHTTVSRVLNGHPLVKPETREKIQKIIHELNFAPRVSARSMISGKSYMVGMLVMYDLEKVPAEFFSSVLAGMTPRLNQAGLNLTLFFDRIQGKKNQAPLEFLHPNRLDGLFVLGVEMEMELALRLPQFKLPLILVNQRIEGMDLNYVTTDDEGGAYAAVSRLLSMGHRCIGFIGGAPQYSTSIRRREGYLRALRERGISYDPHLEKCGDFDSKKGYEAARELLENQLDLTAIFAANDLMVLGVYKAIRERKLRIPEDVAVVGFDDADFADAMEPPLTTVKKPRTLMGRVAARVMCELLENPDRKEKTQLVLPTRLVVRQSSEGIPKGSGK